MNGLLDRKKLGSCGQKTPAMKIQQVEERTWRRRGMSLDEVGAENL
jgi:hypothetical protein